jgi:putative ABC transport system permease protein
MLLLGAGLAVGGLMAMAAARATSALLYGLTPADPLTLFKAGAALVVVAAAASYIPAGRAARIDPCLALRDD